MKINVHFTKSVGTKEVGASPVITLSLLNRMGLDGKSAYEVAVQQGFAGSEQEWLESLVAPSTEAMKAAHTAAAAANASAGAAGSAVQAAERSGQSAIAAAQSASSAQAAVSQSAQHAGIAAASASAAADAATEAQEMAAAASQAASGAITEVARIYDELNAKFNSLPAAADYKGVRTLGGRYAAGTPALNTGDTVTIELLFTTGDNVTAEQTLLSGTGVNLRIKNSALYCTLGSPDVSVPGFAANTAYHLVITANPLNRYRRVYLNGKAVKDAGASPWITTLTNIGLGNNFQGIIHHCRIFSEVFSLETIRKFWNEACPHLYSMPESFLPANSGTCMAEYIPRGISNTAWADTSGNGFNLHPEGAAAPTGTAPSNMSYRIISSGLVTTNGNVTISLPIPPGYYADQIVFTNFNDVQIENIAMRFLLTSSVIAEVPTLQALGTWACNPMTTSRAYKDNDYVYVTAKCNTSAGGCRVDVRVVSI